MVAMKKSPWQERKTIKVVGDTANYFQGESGITEKQLKALGFRQD